MTRTKRNILTILVCNLIFLIAVALLWHFFIDPVVSFTEECPVLEKGERYRAGDYIADKRGEVTPESNFLDTDKVGEYSSTYTVKNWMFTKTYDLMYKVVDTTPPQITVITEKLVLEPGTPYSAADMEQNITVDEGDLAFESDYDPDFPGEYYVKVTAVDESGNRSETKYEIIVGDDEPPMVFRSGNGTLLEIGDEVELENLLSYGDNADPSPHLELTGTYDKNEVGKYPIHAVLTDVSGNKTEWDFTIEVAEDVPTDDTQPDFYPFSQFKADHAGEGLHYGIDVSRWQGDIDFQKVKNAGCEFVIMRIGYSEDGELFLDKYFRQNYERAKSAGIPVGVYVFSYEGNEEDVRRSTQMLIDELGGEALEMPIVFDWENFSHFQNYSISFRTLNHLYDVFEEIVTASGYDCMLYGSKYYLQAVWKNTDTRPVWLAHFTSRTNYEGPYRIWQASATGKIDGIDAYVDMNILYE